MLSSFPLDVSLLATDRDLAAEIVDLRSRGIQTDTYGIPGPTDDIADVGFALTTWFVDPFNNSIGLIQLKTNEAAQT